MKQFLMPEDLVNALLQYLGKRPLEEVYSLHAGMLKMNIAIMAPPTDGPELAAVPTPIEKT